MPFRTPHRTHRLEPGPAASSAEGEALPGRAPGESRFDESGELRLVPCRARWPDGIRRGTAGVDGAEDVREASSVGFWPGVLDAFQKVEQTSGVATSSVLERRRRGRRAGAAHPSVGLCGSSRVAGWEDHVGVGARSLALSPTERGITKRDIETGDGPNVGQRQRE